MRHCWSLSADERIHQRQARADLLVQERGKHVGRTFGSERLRKHRKLQQNGLFLSFPYVCPEPVLVKCSFLYING